VEEVVVVEFRDLQFREVENWSKFWWETNISVVVHWFVGESALQRAEPCARPSSRVSEWTRRGRVSLDIHVLKTKCQDTHHPSHSISIMSSTGTGWAQLRQQARSLETQVDLTPQPALYMD